MNKRIKFALLTALLTGSIAPAVSFAQVGTGKVVAVVAGEPISQSELNERIKINAEVPVKKRAKHSWPNIRVTN